MTAGTAARAEQAGDIMNAAGTVLTDRMWARIKNMLPGRKSDPGGTAADSRLLLEAVPVRFRTGSPWCDLPERSGNRNGVSRRFPAPGPFGRFRACPQRPVGGFLS